MTHAVTITKMTKRMLQAHQTRGCRSRGGCQSCGGCQSAAAVSEAAPAAASEAPAALSKAAPAAVKATKATRLCQLAAKAGACEQEQSIGNTSIEYVFSLAVPDKGTYYLKATASVPCQICTPAAQFYMQFRKGMRTSCCSGGGRGRFAAQSRIRDSQSHGPKVTALPKAANVRQLATCAGA